MDGDLPEPDSPQILPKADVCFEGVMKLVQQQVRNLSEMEASARVLIVLLEVIRHFPQIHLKLQPEVTHHATFTDFYFIIKDSKNPLLIVEVKKMTINAEIYPGSDSVAQVLREAHIILCEGGKVSELPFILTNSSIWGFGKAERKDNQKKMQVTSVYNAIFNLRDKSQYASLVGHITDIMKVQVEKLSPSHE